jgi:hypothetical protein
VSAQTWSRIHSPGTLPRGEVEDVGLGEEWRHDEDRNRVPSWPASLVAHKAHLAPLPDDIRLSRSRPGVGSLLQLWHPYLRGACRLDGPTRGFAVDSRRPPKLAVVGGGRGRRVLCADGHPPECRGCGSRRRRAARGCPDPVAWRRTIAAVMTRPETSSQWKTGPVRPPGRQNPTPLGRLPVTST